MVGNCDGCPSSALTLKSAIEEAIVEKAPDVSGIEVEGATASGPAVPGSLVHIALPVLQR
jgi:Fe-S cluster biogenesis protein NfuA